MARLTRHEARGILALCRLDPGADFHALPSEQVQRLIDAADARGYRKQTNANGSRARCFHSYLTRAAYGARDD